MEESSGEECSGECRSTVWRGVQVRGAPSEEMGKENGLSSGDMLGG